MIDVSVCQLTGICVPHVVPNLGGEIAKTAANTFLTVVASSLSLSASYLIGHVIALIDLPSPNLSVGWFLTERAQMEQVVMYMVLPVLMAGSLGAVLKQDFKRLGRVWAVGLPVALLAGLAGAALATLGLQATDQISAQMTPGGSSSLAGQLGGAVTAVASSAAPAFVKMIILGLMILGAVMIWLELLLRASAVYLAVFFMPLALVGYIWPATAHLAKRVVETVAALILSKFVIVAALALGEAALEAKTPDQSLDGAIIGGTILLIAAFAPFCLLRLAPIVEVAAITHLEGMSRRPMQATSRAATTAVATFMPAARAVLAMANRTPAGGGVGPAAGGVASAVKVAAQPLPQRKPDYPVPAAPASRDA